MPVSIAGRPARSRAGRRAAGLALAAGLSLLTACGHPTRPASTTSSAPASTASPSPGRASMAARAGTAPAPSGPADELNTEILDDLFPVSGAQYTAGAQFEGTEQALAVAASAACLARAGFHIQQQTSAAWATGYFDNSQFPDLARIARTGRFGPYLDDLPQAQVPASRQDAYRQAAARCGAAVPQPYGSLAPVAGTLKVQWLHTVAAVQSSAEVEAQVDQFRSCAQQAGAPASVVRPAPSDQAFSSFLAWITGLESQAGGQAGWATVNRHWAPVFVRCAGPTVAVQTRLLTADRQTFLTVHQRQIQALETTADQAVPQLERQYGLAAHG